MPVLYDKYGMALLRYKFFQEYLHMKIQFLWLLVVKVLNVNCTHSEMTSEKVVDCNIIPF
jgi:hypothetical protein